MTGGGADGSAAGSAGPGFDRGAGGAVRIRPSRPEDAGALEALQVACFPTLAPHERMRAAHFRHHLTLFADADLVAHEGDRIVGLGSGFLTDFDFANADHAFQDVIDGGWYGGHDPDGAWYYGADISVHPDWRGRGVGGRLYDARKDLVRRLGRRGIVAGGMLPGYDAVRDRMDVPEYVRRVVAGELRDPTLTFQLRHGFRVAGLLRDYIDDPASDGWATLIVWEAEATAGGTALG